MPPEPPQLPGRHMRSHRLSTQSGRDPRFYALVLAALGLLLVIDQVRALLSYGQHQTDEDQTLLWLAGRDIFHLHFHEPNFFGQNYNTTFEAIPGQVFHLLGMSFGLAEPLGTTLLLTACWVVLAFSAYKRRNYIAAAAALGIPVCLPTSYLLLADAPRGVLSGDLLCAVCVAVAYAGRSPRLQIAVIISCGGLALLWDNATALAVIPAAAAAMSGSAGYLLKRPLTTLVSAVAGAILPLSWLEFDTWWYRSHPIDLTTYILVPKGVSFSTLTHNLGNLGPLVGYFEPQLYQHLLPLVIALLVLVIAAFYISLTKWRPEPAVGAIALLLAILVTFSIKDTLNYFSGLYVSGDRFLLPLPMGIWAVIAFTTDRALHSRHSPQIFERHSESRQRGLLLALGLIFVTALASFISSQIFFASVAASTIRVDATPAAVVRVMTPGALIQDCATLSHEYHQSHAQLLLTNNFDFAYGCTAEDGLDTVQQAYDRRGWVLESVAKDPITRILIQGRTCSAETTPAGRCIPEGNGNSLLVTPPVPAGVSLALEGLPVRGAPIRARGN